MVTKVPTFGWVPDNVQISLSKDQDFIFTIDPDDPLAIPDGTIVVMHIYEPGTDKLAIESWVEPLDSWDATVSEGIVSWNIPSSQADVIPKKAYARIILTYPDGGDYVWAHGLVVRDDRSTAH